MEVYEVKARSNLMEGGYWQKLNPQLKVVRSIALHQREEFFDAISFEINNDKSIKTQIEEFIFCNVILKMFGKNNCKPQHPTVRLFSFEKCNFLNIHITNCPQLKEVRIINCTGSLELKGLKLDKLIFATDNDEKLTKIENCSLQEIYVNGIVKNNNKEENKTIQSYKQLFNQLQINTCYIQNLHTDCENFILQQNTKIQQLQERLNRSTEKLKYQYSKK